MLTPVTAESLGVQDVEVGQNTDITALEGLKNNLLSEGASIVLLFILGRDDQLYQFSYGGLLWYPGSIAVVSLPATGARKTYQIPYRAMFKGDWDILGACGGAAGDIRCVVTEDGRVVGMSIIDVNAYFNPVHQVWFRNILKVT